MDFECEARIQKQLRAIVFTIRPSIVWTIDGVTPPMDLLDDDGIIGWQVGLGSIRTQLRGSIDVDGLELFNWIDRELELEKSRWRNPRMVLAQARVVLGSKNWQMSRDQDLLRCWLTNIDAALARSPTTHRTPLLATQRYATHVLSLLNHDVLRQEVLKSGSDASTTLSKLERITQLEPLRGECETANEDHLRLVNKSDLLMLDRWLCATATHEAATV